MTGANDVPRVHAHPLIRKFTRAGIRALSAEFSKLAAARK
jgi:hypothetical protein